MHHQRALPYFCLQLMRSRLMVMVNYNNYLQNEAGSLWEGRAQRSLIKITQTHQQKVLLITQSLVRSFCSLVVNYRRGG